MIYSIITCLLPGLPKGPIASLHLMGQCQAFLAESAKTGDDLQHEDGTSRDAQTNTFYVEEIRDLREENFEGGANNMKLDKENAQRSNFHTKYPS